MKRKQPKIRREVVVHGSKTGRVITKGSHIVELLPPDRPESLDEWERWIVLNANQFSCVYKIGPGQILTHWYDKLRPAIEDKQRNDRAKKHKYPGMVYAATSSGRSTMLAPSQYDAMLKLRGEA